MKTHKEKIAAIRAKCIEANPSILDLVFGCEINVSNDLGEYVGEFLNAHYIQFKKYPVPQILNKNECPNFEIIGRPIRLADVLSAIKQGTSYAVDARGEFVKFENDDDYEDLGVKWNLRNDDLTKQSPETINFIYNLLLPTPKS